EFTDKPPVIQCEGCQGFYRKAVCKTAVKCRLCAEDHHENEHGEKCMRCMQARAEAADKGETAPVCTHRRCANCKDGEHANHAANDRQCPVRIRRLGDHRDPKPTRPVGNMGANGGWQKVTRKRKGKKQMNPATEAGTESEADLPTSGRRYVDDPLSEKEAITALQVVFPQIRNERLAQMWKERNGNSLAKVIETIRHTEQLGHSQ
ncbi:hypothetical protein EDD18DRAFT_1077568, partial [Armillaria luteobubalina]